MKALRSAALAVRTPLTRTQSLARFSLRINVYCVECDGVCPTDRFVCAALMRARSLARAPMHCSSSIVLALRPACLPLWVPSVRLCPSRVMPRIADSRIVRPRCPPPVCCCLSPSFMMRCFSPPRCSPVVGMEGKNASCAADAFCRFAAAYASRFDSRITRKVTPFTSSIS